VNESQSENDQSENEELNQKSHVDYVEIKPRKEREKVKRKYISICDPKGTTNTT
jgi:hypothetical protein